jgi:hypothetical protein
MTEINVGANSKITDCLVANPMRFLGKSGLFKFKAVCIATTPPTKNDMNDTIPIDPIINESISLMIRPFITLHLVNLPNTFPIIIE